LCQSFRVPHGVCTGRRLCRLGLPATAPETFWSSMPSLTLATNCRRQVCIPAPTTRPRYTDPTPPLQIPFDPKRNSALLEHHSAPNSPQTPPGATRAAHQRRLRALTGAPPLPPTPPSHPSSVPLLYACGCLSAALCVVQHNGIPVAILCTTQREYPWPPMANLTWAASGVMLPPHSKTAKQLALRQSKQTGRACEPGNLGAQLCDEGCVRLFHRDR
jgi:hypothetical protein